jgi:hypothetical protein
MVTAGTWAMRAQQSLIVAHDLRTGLEDISTYIQEAGM